MRRTPQHPKVIDIRHQVLPLERLASGWPGNCLDWGGSLLGFGNIFFLLFSAALPLGPCDIAVLGWTLQLVMVEQGGFILQG